MAGAIMVVALASRFWRLGCPKIYHEVATRLMIAKMRGKQAFVLEQQIQITEHLLLIGDCKG